MGLGMTMPKKVEDVQILAEIANYSEAIEVIVGPTERELQDVLKLGRGSMNRRIHKLQERGLVQRAYRGLTLTPAGATHLEKETHAKPR